MRLAVFSDIHGNLYAFEAVYKQIKKEACDLHLFLGDVCGYYYYQNEVIEIFREIPQLVAITGNHDRMFLDALEDDEKLWSYTQTYGRSFEFLKKNITQESLDFLKGLPIEYIHKDQGLAAYHGSPWNPIHEYIYPDACMERFDELPFKAVFMGHTHRPMDIKRNGIRIVNPGSAGQPRDGGWPSYAVYDTEKDSVEIKRVPYNIDSMLAEIKKRDDDNAYLPVVLLRARESA